MIKKKRNCEKLIPFIHLKGKRKLHFVKRQHYKNKY
jgi:hypothetical protein